MPTQVYVESAAVDRLAELDLTAEVIERVVRRADAEASTCTRLDPPIMEGIVRWARTTRFLREELVIGGWRYDNPRNLSRTIHPGGEFAIVVTTGDEMTAVAEVMPRTKYPKGFATASAVVINEQLAFEYEGFCADQADGQAQDAGDLRTWLLLFHVDEDGFHVELSLPDAIVDGHITSWIDRIILPVFPREDDALTVSAESGDDGQGDVVVDVSRR